MPPKVDIYKLTEEFLIMHTNGQQSVQFGYKMSYDGPKDGFNDVTNKTNNMLTGFNNNTKFIKWLGN
jgi:hypothetical protein